MAGSLIESELRAALQSPDVIRGDPFLVLKSISEFANDTSNEALGREMVLRALGHRKAFVVGVEVLDALARSVGLYPFADPKALDFRDSIAYEFHKPDNMAAGFVFHREQAEIYRRLMAGDNLIVSAPTSFGKSRIIDAMIASGRYKNIAVIVPTLALIDETRRRLADYNAEFKIVTHVSQRPVAKNIFVFTAERAVAYEHFPKLDFFVIDEFYKIGEMEADRTRTIALNEAFYRLRRTGGQFYLLGPNIQRIPDGLETAFRCSFHATNFATVVIETELAPGTGKSLDRLTSFAKTLKEPTLIFCGSPPKANKVARALIKAGVGTATSSMSTAAGWIGSNYHRDWIFGIALKHGIGIHHGKLPRSLAQFVVRAFNEGKLKCLICTSTLIEGVNTRAKNVLIWDTEIAQRHINFFTYNNIKGRSGRMFQQPIGRVIIFEEPPKEEEQYVDFPVFTQGEGSPEALLIQMEESDLSVRSRDRMKKYSERPILSIATMQKNKSIDPDRQVALAEWLQTNALRVHPILSWNGMPTYRRLELVCKVIWKFFVTEKRRHGVWSGEQLANQAWQIWKYNITAKRIKVELKKKGEYAPKSVDEAVERILQFERSWAEFDLPRFLLAVSRIQDEIFTRLGMPPGDYTAYASMLESLFQAPVLASLDEYGIPLSVAAKLADALGTDDDLDVALGNLKSLDFSSVKLGSFEKRLIKNAQEAL